MKFLLGILFILFLSWFILWLLFLPTKIAYSKNTKNKKKIFLLNLFLGLTLVSWIILLVWARNDEILRSDDV